MLSCEGSCGKDLCSLIPDVQLRVGRGLRQGGGVGTRRLVDIVKTHAGGPHYDDVVRLRQRILRDPLGLVLDTSEDAGKTFFVAVEEGRVIGTVALEGARLKQMAVEAEGRGIGRRLVERLEEEARTRGVRRIELHARITARDFYAKLGYVAEGAEFIEVTIPHVRMWKVVGYRNPAPA